MKLPRPAQVLSCCLLACLSLAAQAATESAKPWTRWWWLGSAVDKPNLTRELEAIAAAGFGGVEITPIYGAKGYESRFVPYLSEHYQELLAHTTKEAQRLGLGVDMATGTGWPFGGPQVTAEEAELKLAPFDEQATLQPIPTKFRVKRAAPGGEGWVLDPYSTRALDHYLERFTSALQSLPPGALHGQFHDSFEYTANWSRELPAYFEQRFGYTLESERQALAGRGDGDRVRRVKADYRTALGEMHLAYVERWVAWSHSLGMRARNQAHGSPGNLLDLYAASDVPETELFGSTDLRIPGFRRVKEEIGKDTPVQMLHRFSASAAHVSGKPLVSSETFTWLREHFCETPAQMKPEADLLFAAGINHLVYHGTAYSPEDAGWPGWLFYASTQANPRNPLWSVIPALNGYFTRTQALLREGQPDSDVLLYWPLQDLWHRPEGLQRQLTVHDPSWLVDSSLGAVARSLEQRGYTYDFISDRWLERATVRDGEIVLPGGTYPVLVVPSAEFMEPATLREVVRLAQAGARVVFQGALPQDVPGWSRLPERREALAAAKKDWASLASQTPARLTVGSADASALVESLASLPGAAHFPALPHPGLASHRRRLPDGHLYFFVNTTGSTVASWIPVHPATQAVWIDTLRDRQGRAKIRSAGLVSEVRVQLDPGESCFVRTGAGAHSPADWLYLRPTGSTFPLSGSWALRFLSGGPTLPAPRSLTALRSWAEDADAAAFAGSAEYRLQFSLPDEEVSKNWILDLGDVREVAQVWLNGQELGTSWSLPHRLETGSALRRGQNELVIVATNTAANRIRDLDQRQVPWKAFYEINFVNIHYKPFDAAGWQVRPAGLLGPVQLQEVQPSSE